jgi:hypothetical protein
VTDVRREYNRYPYMARCIAGEWTGCIQYFGANGESWGTGVGFNKNYVVLDVDYVISKMWEKWDNEV